MRVNFHSLIIKAAKRLKKGEKRKFGRFKIFVRKSEGWKRIILHRLCALAKIFNAKILKFYLSNGYFGGFYEDGVHMF